MSLLCANPFSVWHSSSHQAGAESLSLALESELTLGIALTMKMQQKWYCETSEAKPSETLQLLISSSCKTLTIVRKLASLLNFRDHIEEKVQLTASTRISDLWMRLFLEPPAPSELTAAWSLVSKLRRRGPLPTQPTEYEKWSIIALWSYRALGWFVM